MILEVALPVNINKNFDYFSDDEVKIGCRVVVPFVKKKLIGFVVAVKSAAVDDRPLKKIIKIFEREPIITDELIKLAGWISQYYLCSFGIALNHILPQGSRLPTKKIELLYRRSHSETSIAHTGEQKSASGKIVETLEKSRQKTFLLYGMNDSGKTEVYLRAIDRCLKNNMSAIYLVPDVSLTSQFKELLRNRFGEAFGVWHSDLSQKAKKQFLTRLKLGKIKVILGTRSAVFLPLENTKLFIIDEEDDDFYKNLQTPKYHVRDVAIQRAKISNAVVVLGSATPSIETFYKTKTGEIEVLRLSDRIENRPLPKITVVDLKYVSHVSLRTITKPLKYAVSNAILQKKQVFLLVNRRGWATTVRCGGCGNVIRCPKCSIPLVAHKTSSKLLCHYCGYKQEFLKVCPVCNSGLIYSGYGTERVEEIVRKIFSAVETIRIDADAEMPYSKMFKIMKSGKPCILIGTQIVAKGFDFQNLTVVGIINAYYGLYSADFRSAERTFSLITHSIGRCGRGPSTGQVIIQADNPEHYAIKYAAEFDYETFFEKEMTFRKEFLWPPFVKLINITISGKNEKDVITESENLAEKLDNASQRIGLTVLGPVPKVAPYLAGKHRWQILLKLQETDFSGISKNLLNIVNSRSHKNVNIVFDVDPLETV